MSESTPLNARLHGMLVRAFEEVRIANEGQRFVGREVHDPLRGGMRLNVVEPGEQYAVNCPFCGDERKRLYISHKWNTIDENGKVFGRWLVNCFNEECLRIDGREFNWERIVELEDMMKPYMMRRPRIQRRPEDGIRREVTNFKETTLPGVCVPLNSLAVDHPARKYIESRDFSCDELTVEWGVQYCEKHEHPYIRNRVIIPINYNGKLVGWQARAITEKHDGPKYFTAPGLQKSKMLFNGDRARTFDFGVVVEGVFDAFRVGPRAVALLGKSMNTTQQQLVHRWWNNGAVCLLLDPDALEDMERISKLLSARAYRWGAFSVLLPEDNDPADMKRDELWEIIVGYARNRGIKILDCAAGPGRRNAGVVSGK